MTIQMIQRDIDNGEPGVCSSCPIALAIKRTFGLQNNVEVSDFIWVQNRVYRITEKIFRFIERFDNESGNKKLPKPIKFRLIKA